MGHSNILTNVVVNVKADDNGIDLSELYSTLDHVHTLYSYLVYAEYADNKLTGWRCEFMISQTDKFNTIKATDAKIEVSSIIVKNLSKDKIRYVIGYKQPPLELLLDTFEPLVCKLARQQESYWGIEYEDLCQMCRLCICALYKKGYYIHKRLINRTFINDVLSSIRKERYKPIIVSIDEPVAYDKDGNKQMVEDIIADENAEADIMEQFDQEDVDYWIKQKRDIIVEYIGQRQYDQLIREYGNKMTTNAGRKQVDKLKHKLAADGINEALFRRLK